VQIFDPASAGWLVVPALAGSALANPIAARNIGRSRKLKLELQTSLNGGGKSL
jgi:hypothetical protein